MVVDLPPPAEFYAEVSQGSEVNPAHELLRENPVEPLKLPSSPRVVGSSVDQLDVVTLAELAKLLGDEATPVVHVDCLGLTAALEGPPEVVGGLASPLPPIASSHHQEARTIIQNRVDVDLSPHSCDAELVNVHLPERVDVVSLEPLERHGLLDDPDHEPVPLQQAVNRTPAHSDPSAGKDGVDPLRPPGRVSPPQLEDSIGQVPVDSVRTLVGTARVRAEPLHAFLPVVSAPTS